MSAEYPIVSITGSSGAGSSFVTKALERVFKKELVKAVYVQGSGFHRYERKEMQARILQARTSGKHLSHFGPEGNHLDKLESLFFQYGTTGTGKHRYYLHTRECSEGWGQEPGTLTPWQDLEENSDLLLYRGLHGAAVTDEIDISQYPDLTIGVVPNVNLEWIRKIKRDTFLRDCSPEEVKKSILDRMHDYIYHITPQFKRTDINLQMIPVVDTSDPFNMTTIPEDYECFLVIHFCKKQDIDYVRLLELLPESFMSRSDTLVVPAGQMFHSIEVIMTPLIRNLVAKSRELRNIKSIPEDHRSGLIGVLGQSTI